jgi:hypothetical protein
MEALGFSGARRPAVFSPETAKTTGRHRFFGSDTSSEFLAKGGSFERHRYRDPDITGAAVRS